MTSSNNIVNGILCYISTARHTLSEETIVNVCQVFYSSESIREAKELIYTFTDDNFVSWRGDGKVKADLIDILSVVCKLDDGMKDIPKFLADTYKSIPPSSDFEVLAEYMISLMSEVASLKDEIVGLKSTLKDVKVSDMVDAKEELCDIKNILLQKSFATPATNVQIKSDGIHKSYAWALNSGGAQKSKNCQEEKSLANCKVDRKPIRRDTLTDIEVPTLEEAGATISMDLDALTRRLVESEDTGEGGPQPWQVVNRKKRPFTGVKGTQKNEGRLKKVSECCDFYVGRCSPETSVDDINNFVSNVIDVPNHILCENFG